MYTPSNGEKILTKIFTAFVSSFNDIQWLTDKMELLEVDIAMYLHTLCVQTPQTWHD